MSSKRLEILTEEASMQFFLEGLLPYILPEDYQLNVNCFVYPHQGKSDLQKRLPKRIRAYQSYPEEVLVMVVHDQDSNNCIQLKNELLDCFNIANNDIKYVVRIACRELENWYLGDLAAIEKLYPKSKASKYSEKAKSRNPDKLQGSEEMKRLSADFTKINCAMRIAHLMDIGKNNSGSFNHFISGLRKLLA
jgi:hypothetical protein